MPRGLPTPDTCDVRCIHPATVAAVRSRLVPLEDAQVVARTFGVLADPSRLRLLQALLERELCVCDLAAVLQMRQPAVSQQLRILRAQDVVRVRKVGHIAYYALLDATITRLLTQALTTIPTPASEDAAAGAA